MQRYCYFFLLAVFLFSCSGSKKTVEKLTTQMITENSTVVPEQRNLSVNAGAPTLIYKTTGDFSNYVPVTMNAKKTQILSYPAPADIRENAKPTQLKDGWLLDNRGIGVYSVFLDYTYEEYANLSQVPSLAELQAHILEKNPLTELVNCGSRYQYKDMVAELNALIDKNLEGCEILLKQ
jgi:hypothetical protein